MAAKRKTKDSVPGIAYVRTLGGISEYTLKSNGLSILLAPDNSQSVAGCMVTYHVGSRNEATGYTGATHILEHLMFKGSKKFNKKAKTTVWDLLETKGALVNATTWFDRTNYYEVVPKEYLPIAIELEADRMRNAFIAEEDRQSEMTVVRNEFERGENLPQEALEKLIWATAFQAHPYHHSTIGWRSDIEKVPIERLRQFYDDFYWPDNATVTIAGNFDAAETLSLIKKHFGAYPRNPKPYPELYTEEPPQEGERRGIVKRAGVNMISIAHKVPNAHHLDTPALNVLDFILSYGKSSRLERALVDTGMATETYTFYLGLRDPGLFQTFVTMADGTSHEQIEAALKDVYADLQRHGVTAQEVARAKRFERSVHAQRRDGTYAFLATLNEEIATGDWTRFVTLSKAMSTVTPADVKRVARTYFNDQTATVGWFVNTAI